jgi:thiol-disulfide isomerase/thioredoxin
MSKRWMVLPVLALLVLAAVRCGGAPAPDAKTAPGKTAPVAAVAAAAQPAAAKVTLLSGYDLAKVKGKVNFVELWGVWCPPCIRSMPHVQELFEKYKSNPAFSLMVVNTGWRGDNAQKIQNWQAQNPKYTFPVFLDDRPQEQSFAALNQVNSIPRSLIYDKKGKVRYNGHPMEIPPTLLDNLLKE